MAPAFGAAGGRALVEDAGILRSGDAATTEAGRVRRPARKHFFDDPGNVKKVLRVFYAVCAALLLADFVVHRHVVHEWEGLWGFYAGYGFVACVLLVLIAKEMRKLLMRREDYYDGDDG